MTDEEDGVAWEGLISLGFKTSRLSLNGAKHLRECMRSRALRIQR